MSEGATFGAREDLLSRVVNALSRRGEGGEAEGANISPAQLPFAVGFSVSEQGGLMLEARVAEGNDEIIQEVLGFQRERPEIQVNLEQLFWPGKSRRLPSEQPPHPALSVPADTLFPGLSIGHKNVPAATLGAFVKCQDGRIAALTAAHAVGSVGDDSAELKGWIFQPGRPDVRVLTALRRVGRVRDFSAISHTTLNTVDAALIDIEKPWVPKCTNRIPALGTFADNVVVKGAPLNHDQIRALGPRPRVWKIGRQTGVTEGTLSAFDVKGVSIDYGDVQCPFEEALEIKWDDEKIPFSGPGDSGSVVLTREGNLPIGLHFAGFESKNKSFSCLLANICETFKVSLIEN